MADITDVTAIAFANEKIRVIATHMTRLYYSAKAIVDEWNARGGSAMIPNMQDAIADGASKDGRPVITGAHATNVITRLIEYVNDMEANNNAKLNTLITSAKPERISLNDL